MPGNSVQFAPQLTMQQLHAFRESRPEPEKWELIDSVPLQKDCPTIVHQRIASNLQGLLHKRLESARPEWQAERRVSILLKGEERYNPEPDVTVIDTAIAIGQIYVVRFYFVAEVLSESDKKEVLEAKLAYYTGHEHNRCVLFVRQDRIGADQHDRHSDGTWRSQRLDSAQAPLSFAEIGPIGRLGELYKFTPLDPFAST